MSNIQKVLRAEKVLKSEKDLLEGKRFKIIEQQQTSVLFGNRPVLCVTRQDVWKFIPYVPGILRQKGWLIAEKFQNLWITNKANQLVGEQRQGRGDNGPLHIQHLKLMDWVLGYDRARSVFDSLIQPSVFANEKAKDVLRDKLLPLINTNDQVITFGSFSAKGLQREVEYINRRSITATSSIVSAVFEIDQLHAALGRFQFFVIPRVIAKVKDSIVDVEIKEIGVYLRDSFDFNDFQPLGWWKYPDQVKISDQPLMPNAGIYCFDKDSVPLENATYRQYRSHTGYGMDFLIYSDIKQVKLSSPLTFQLKI